MFDHIPDYDRYRTLELKSPTLKGEDVFALQVAMDETGYDTGTHDGILGPRTAQAITDVQTNYFLVIDGKAGGNTQKSLTLTIASRVAKAKKVRYDCMLGQLEHESSFRLGMYSLPPRPDGSFDAGVAQRNSNETALKEGFDPELSINALAARIRKHYEMFDGLPERRRWILAQGSWNAPAYACYIAREEGAKGVNVRDTKKPSVSARQTFETYMVKVSKYVQL